MTLLIDGHNLIGAIPDIDLADPDDEWQLVQRLRSFVAGPQRQLTVVFDSGVGPTPHWDLSGGGVRVRFAPPGVEADAIILDIVRRSKQPERITVVTSDRRLAALVRAAGGQVRSARQFASRLTQTLRGMQPASAPAESYDPHDPAFADIYAGFAVADKDRPRFGADIDQDLDAWIEKLYGDDPAEAGRAAHWLGRFGGSAALEPLLDALTHSQGRVRAAALLALADLGDRAAAEAVAERLAHDQSSMVREAAAQCLARLGGPMAATALQQALSDSKRKVRKAAKLGLAQLQARRGR